MIYERLIIMRNLLAEDGSVYVHCDCRLNSHIRLVLNEIFGSRNFRNEIAWRKTNSPKAQSTCFGNQKDTIFLYSKSSDVCFHPAKRKPDEKYLKSFRYKDKRGRYTKPWHFLIQPIKEDLPRCRVLSGEGKLQGGCCHIKI